MLLVPIFNSETDDDDAGRLLWMEAAGDRVVPVFASAHEFETFGSIYPKHFYVGYALTAIAIEDISFDELTSAFAEQLKVDGARFLKDDDPLYARIIVALALDPGIQEGTAPPAV